jgi:hypothetical protein
MDGWAEQFFCAGESKVTWDCGSLIGTACVLAEVRVLAANSIKFHLAGLSDSKQQVPSRSSSVDDQITFNSQ